MHWYDTVDVGHGGRVGKMKLGRVDGKFADAGGEVERK